jgi:hypothetical protein
MGSEGRVGMIGEVWQLRRGGEVLGEITMTEADFPWLSGSFAERPGFAEVAPLFAEELALSMLIGDDDSPANVDAWGGGIRPHRQDDDVGVPVGSGSGVPAAYRRG